MADKDEIVTGQKPRRCFANMANAKRENIAVKVGCFTQLSMALKSLRALSFSVPILSLLPGAIAPDVRRIIGVKRACSVKISCGTTDQGPSRPIIVNLLIAPSPSISKRRARDEMLQPLARLAPDRYQTGRAPRHHICLAIFALLRAPRAATTGRAALSGNTKAGTCRPRGAHHPPHAQSCGITSPARCNDHAVANTDIFARNLISIVQRGIRHHHPPNGDLVRAWQPASSAPVRPT